MRFTFPLVRIPLRAYTHTMSLIGRYARFTTLHVMCKLYSVWTWLVPSGISAINESASYTPSTKPTLSLTSWPPFFRRVRRGFTRTSRETRECIRVYPVNGSGSYTTHGNFTIVYCRELPPPLRSFTALPIAAASLLDAYTGKGHNVTDEIVRLAGPRYDFFGFRYNLRMLTPWLCDRHQIIANARDLSLHVCVDDTFEVFTFDGTQPIILPALSHQLV